MTQFHHFRRGLAGPLATLILLSGAAVAVSACNTTAGVGKDVSATGNAVTNAAEKTKSGL
jgi:predicted small secreted protein